MQAKTRSPACGAPPTTAIDECFRGDPSHPHSILYPRFLSVNSVWVLVYMAEPAQAPVYSEPGSTSVGSGQWAGAWVLGCQLLGQTLRRRGWAYPGLGTFQGHADLLLRLLNHLLLALQILLQLLPPLQVVLVQLHLLLQLADLGVQL